MSLNLFRSVTICLHRGDSHVTSTRNIWVKSNTTDAVETRVIATVL